MGKSSITFEDLYHMPVDEIENNGRDSGTFGDGMRLHAKEIDKLGGRVPNYYKSTDGQVLEETLYVEAPPFKKAGGKFDEIGTALNELAKDLSELKTKAQGLAKEVESTPFLEWADRTNGVARVQELDAAQREQLTPREKQLYQEAVSKVGPLNEKIKATVKAARAADDRASSQIEALKPDGAEKKKPPVDEDERPRGPGDKDTTGDKKTGGNTDGTKKDDDGTGEKPGDKDRNDEDEPDRDEQDQDGEAGPGENDQNEDRQDPDAGGQSPGEQDGGEYPGEDGSTDPDEWNPDDDYEGGGLADGGGVGGGLGAAGGGGGGIGGGAGAAGGGVTGGAGAASGAAGGVPMPVGAAGAAGSGVRGGLPLGGGMMGAGHGGQGGGDGGGEHTWLSEDEDPFGTGDAAPPVIGYLPPAPAAEATEAERPAGGGVASFS